jgi:hypothetical protein
MNITYLTLLTIIENFSKNHLQIQRFKSDFLEQIGNFGTEAEAYPILYVTPNTVQFNNFTSGDFNTISINIYCVDIIQCDRSNVNTILNSCNLILNDLHLYLKNSDIPGINLSNISSTLPLNNYMLDETGGWYMTLTFETNSTTICDIPFENIPIFTSEICDFRYEQFVTIEQFDILQTQFDILQAQVNILLGL